MSNKTNEEKLRILQERLTQIKQKETSSSENIEKVSEIPNTTIETHQKEKTTISLGWLKYVVILGGIGYLSFYAYKNINLDSLKSGETSASQIHSIEKADSAINYSLELTGNNIVIIATLEGEGSAKAMVNDLVVKGFKADYFYLPYKSNSTEKVYQVFIGPYENEEETNQWTKNIKSDFKIIQL